MKIKPRPGAGFAFICRVAAALPGLSTAFSLEAFVKRSAAGRKHRFAGAFMRSYSGADAAPNHLALGGRSRYAVKWCVTASAEQEASTSTKLALHLNFGQTR